MRMIHFKLTSFFLLLSFILTALSTPPLVFAQSASCSSIGVNSAFLFKQGNGFYEKIAKNNMGWSLEIADNSNPQATIDGINAALAAGITPIIRIGIGGDSFGFTDPADYFSFLNTVASQVSGGFYAVAGPNEPDAEHWLGDYNIGDESSPNQSGIDTAGQLLAGYVNYLGDRRATLDAKVKLLTPSINITSWSGSFIFQAILNKGMRLAPLSGISVTAYNTFDRPDGRLTSHLNRLFKKVPALTGTPVFITEIGSAEVLGGTTPREKAMKNLSEEVDNIKKGTLNIQAALLYNALNTSPDTAWQPFALSQSEISLVLGPDCATDESGAIDTKPRKLCDTVPLSLQSRCIDCFEKKQGAWTAIGCIESDPKVFVGRLLGLGIGAAGGIAFLLILIGSLRILTSAGNPEHIHEGRELIVAAIVGLLFIIFSLFILRITGLSVLGIPGFK